MMEVRGLISALSFAQLDPPGREITDIGNSQRRNDSMDEESGCRQQARYHGR